MTATDGAFERMQAADMAKERRIFWYELGVAAVVVFLLLVYLIVSGSLAL